MSQYKTGTASVINGSQTTTGSGTAWLANVSVGDVFKVNGIDTHYTIGAVVSDTQLTLNANWAGSTLSNQGYQIVRDFTSNLNLPEVFSGDAEWWYHLTEGLRKLDTAVGQNLHTTSSPTFASLLANFYATAQSLSSLTIPAGQNNLSIGPITATGTIAVNGEWTII